jgi:RNA polymerase sigma factor (sigma-70 family)
MLSIEAVEALYRARSAYLARVVRLDTRACEEVVEDACQHAWSSVLAHRERVDERCAFAWLTSTAMHEAWRLAQRREACSWPLEPSPMDPRACGDAPAASATSGAPWGSPTVMAPPACTPLELVEMRDELEALGSLPRRQQRLLWLHAAGLTYAEMARHEGVTLRTVERQLLRAKRAARVLAGVGSAKSRACPAVA